MNEIVDFARANVTFTSTDVRVRFPDYSPANVTRMLKILTDRGVLERRAVGKHRRNGPMYEYSMKAVIS